MNSSHTLDSWFDVGQIRLSEISVFNWGTFDGYHTGIIDRDGTFITGETGAGKSTLVDAHQVTLHPAGRTAFNIAAAQNDKTDRTLLSYMRGTFGSAHDGSGTSTKSKRNSSVVSAVRSMYTADDSSKVTLIALFWTALSTNSLSDVKRIYIIGKRDIKLKEVLDAFGKGESRGLKAWLKTDNLIQCCDDNFKEYQDLYRKLLYMDNPNAPNLLSRALGLKKIDDLTKLIRELVLEPSEIKNDARKIVHEFKDLETIYQKLIDAKQQQEQLSKLPEYKQQIDQATIEITNCQEDKKAIPVVLAEYQHTYWSEQRAAFDKELEKISEILEELSEKEGLANKEVKLRYSEFNNAGGDKLGRLEQSLSDASATLEKVIENSSEYQTIARVLELNDSLSLKTFEQNIQLASEYLNNSESLTESAQNEFGKAAGSYSELTNTQSRLQEEIKEISARPDSNIPVSYHKLRDQLVHSTNISTDELAFIGELIDVKDEHISWRGAIERALGGLKTTLLVSQHQYSVVTGWLNNTYTGLHVRVQIAHNTASPKQFKTNGFLRKLEWKKHQYRDWLKAHLAKFDLNCVGDIDTFNNTPYSLTKEGLTQFEKGRFEKKDLNRVTDTNYWYLGFSNKHQLKALQTKLSEVEGDIKTSFTALEEARSVMNDTANKLRSWDSLSKYKWKDINSEYWSNKVKEIGTEIDQYQTGNKELTDRKLKLEQAEKAHEEIKGQILTKTAKQALKEEDVSYSTKKINQQLETMKANIDSEAKERILSLIKPLNESDIPDVINIERDNNKIIDSRLESLGGLKESLVSRATGDMGAYRKKWQNVAADWGTDIDSIQQYINQLNSIEKDGLPELVQKFKERLNKHTTQSLAGLRQRILNEHEEIIDRIQTINKVLAKTEFRTNTHLQLGHRKEEFSVVKEFNKALKNVFSQVSSEDHEARFLQLKSVVKTLSDASDPTTHMNKASLQLLDPRYQLSFHANEIDRANDEIVDVLESSSGKSGGEKESFAGIIVAASLAYVLMPDGYDKPIYSTVFLDEAFSNTSEKVSRRVLKVFKELKLHVNLITPFKNLNLARDSASSLLIIEKEQEQNTSSIIEVTWEEANRMLAKRREEKALEEAKALEVEFETE